MAPWELPLALCVVALGAYLAFPILGTEASAYTDTDELVAAVRWCTIGLSALALLAPRVPARLREWVPVTFASLGAFVLLAHLLRTTSFSVGGSSQDSGFIIEQLVAAKYYRWPVDGTYAGLSAFYPPLYTQLLGKVAAHFDLQAASMWKWGGLAAACAVPLLAFASWVPLIGRRAAVALVSIAVFSEPIMQLHKSHEWIALYLFLPWWLRYVLVPVAADEPGLGRWQAAWGAVAGALLFATFYYYFFVGGLSLAMCGAWVLMRERRKPAAMGFVVLAGTALLSSVYWAPLLVDMLVIDNTPMQQRWFAAYMKRFPVPLRWSFPSVLLWLGVLASVPWRHFSRQVAGKTFDASDSHLRVTRALRWMVVAGFAWHGIGRMGDELGVPLLHVKAVPLLRYALYASAAVWLIDAVQRRIAPAANVITAFGVVAALWIQAPGYASIRSNGLYEKGLAMQRREPERQFMLRSGVLGDLHGKTILADRPGSLGFTPAFAFLGLGQHYAHPAARFEERYRFLEALTKLDDANEVCLLLRHNMFAPVDFVWWDPRQSKVVYMDDFPKGVRARAIKWTGNGRRGACLKRVAKRGFGKRFRRVIDPGLTRASRLSPDAAALAVRFGDKELRAMAPSLACRDPRCQPR